MFKKWISSFVVLYVIFLAFQYASVQAAGPLNASSRIEALLVVDVSKSMLDSDPHLISNEAMKMFVDMSSVKGDKIGVVAYADEVMRESALVDIRSEQSKKDLKSFIDSLAKYPYTNISVGVNEAVKLLDLGHEDDYFPLIVLLADGNNDLNKSKSKTVQQADDDLAVAVEAAKKKGYPIYTIGLNADGKLNKQVLQNVATSTNGQFFETTTADDLPGILSQIFANHLKLKIVPINQLTANGEFQDITIHVPNENVIEANISLISSQPVKVKLIDPSGTEQPIPSDNILLSTSKSYSMVKLINPVQGDWTLKVKGVPQDKIDINLIFNYDLQLKLAPLVSNGFTAGDIVKIASFFEDNGAKIADKALYSTMKATLLIKDLTNGQTEEIPLTSDEQGFTGDFKLGDSNQYEVLVKAEDNSFFRETAVEKINVQKGATPTAAKVSPIQEEKSFPWLYAGIGALLLIGLLAFFFAKKPKRGFSGQMVVEIKDEDTGERTTPQFKKLKDFQGKIKLHQLLSVAPEFSETDQILFKPDKADMLLIVNQSDCTIEKSGRAIDARKGQLVKRNDRLRILLKKVNKSIYIEYIS
ncbi:VWA domain-containing protein [Bacillus sp. OK048]|uniref:vWA domain-containing protein n=1 Tax=Bacillus sp. OK048 TaxID=1882761 RepID=UPI00088A43A0|nr:vWA domain-containing protein [Bacillus sp. OK048]SDM69379.1 von Willebrand factor type A domain-containing protein [Bacillus sp. OK048]